VIDDDVPWLNDEEQKVWRALLWSLQKLRERLDQQMQRDAGMPHAYYLILVVLAEKPERTASMTELSRVTQFSPSRLSHAVRKLETLGWIARQRHPENGRVVIARLTHDGLNVLRGATPGHVREVRRLLFDRITLEQVRQLGDISLALLAVDPADHAESRGSDAPSESARSG
jgi:DNA-binding MarR family transcriptional regulator